MRLLVPSLISLALLGAACSDDAPTPLPVDHADASVGRDGTVPNADATPRMDAGTNEDAAATHEDATAPNDDATATSDDAAAPAADATAPGDDATTPGDDAAVDGGIVLVDGGPVTDGSINPADGGPAIVDGGPAPTDGGAGPATYVESTIAAPQWVDACAMGTTLMLTDDDDGHSATPTTLPFAFTFWGTPVTSIWADTNGYAVFDVEPFDEFEPAIPFAAEGPAIFALWEDLFDDGASSVCVATVGAAPNRRFVMQWLDWHSLSADDATSLTFEIVLNEATNTVDLLYDTLSAVDPADQTYVDGTSAGIGLQSALGADFVTHAGAVTTTAGLRFTP